MLTLIDPIVGPFVTLYTTPAGHRERRLTVAPLRKPPAMVSQAVGYWDGLHGHGALVGGRPRTLTEGPGVIAVEGRVDRRRGVTGAG